VKFGVTIKYKEHKEVATMETRATIALNVLVDVKLNEGYDMSEIKDIMNGLQGDYIDATGKSVIMGVDIVDRNLIIEKDDEPDAE